MTPRGRVLVVGRGEPERGGIPSFLAMLVDGEAVLGYDVVLLNLAEGARQEGGSLSWNNARRAVTDAVRVLRAARRGDVVHVHSALAPAVTGLRAGLLVRAARVRGARTVVHAHGGRFADSMTSRTRRAVARRTLAPADLVVAVSTRLQQVLLDTGLDPARVRLLPNGVDVEHFTATTDTDGSHRPPRVLFVGGLTPRKGVLDLLQASLLLSDEGVDHEVRLVGGVPDEGTGSYEQVVGALSERTVLVGPVDPAAMPAVYQDADVFCLPSWWEAMPLTVLEAQAAGLPVVATDVGDVRTMLVDGDTGHLVPPRDPVALAGALRALLEDATDRAAMGRRARRLMEESFDHRRMLEALATIYDEVRSP